MTPKSWTNLSQKKEGSPLVHATSSNPSNMAEGARSEIVSFISSSCARCARPPMPVCNSIITPKTPHPHARDPKIRILAHGSTVVCVSSWKRMRAKVAPCNYFCQLELHEHRTRKSLYTLGPKKDMNIDILNCSNSVGKTMCKEDVSIFIRCLILPQEVYVYVLVRSPHKQFLR